MTNCAHPSRRRAARLALLVTAAAFGLTTISTAAVMASGTVPGTDVPAATSTTMAMTTTTVMPITITVNALDYSFANLPPEVPVGTKLSLHNMAPGEVHEMVVLRIPDTELRSVDELIKLPKEETDKLFAGLPALVIVARPGQDGQVMVGDGTLLLPGRYLVLCAIPTGANPDEFFDPKNQTPDGPPKVAGGPPHFTKGMYAELKVVDASGSTALPVLTTDVPQFAQLCEVARAIDASVIPTPEQIDQYATLAPAEIKPYIDTIVTLVGQAGNGDIGAAIMGSAEGRDAVAKLAAWEAQHCAGVS